MLSAFKNDVTLVVQDKVLGLRFHKGNLVAKGLRNVVAKTQNGSSQPKPLGCLLGLPSRDPVLVAKKRREDRVFFHLLLSCCNHHLSRRSGYPRYAGAPPIAMPCSPQLIAASPSSLWVSPKEAAESGCEGRWAPRAAGARGKGAVPSASAYKKLCEEK